MKHFNLPEQWYTPLVTLTEHGDVSLYDLDQDFDDRYEAGQGVLIPVAAADGSILSERRQKAILRHFLTGFSRTKFDLMIGVLRRDPEETVTQILRWCETFRRITGKKQDKNALARIGVQAFAVASPRGVTDPAVQRETYLRALGTGLPTAVYQVPHLSMAELDPALIRELVQTHDNLVLVVRDDALGAPAAEAPAAETPVEEAEEAPSAAEEPPVQEPAPKVMAEEPATEEPAPEPAEEPIVAEEPIIIEQIAEEPVITVPEIGEAAAAEIEAPAGEAASEDAPPVADWIAELALLLEQSRAEKEEPAVAAEPVEAKEPVADWINELVVLLEESKAKAESDATAAPAEAKEPVADWINELVVLLEEHKAEAKVKRMKRVIAIELIALLLLGFGVFATIQVRAAQKRSDAIAVASTEHFMQNASPVIGEGRNAAHKEADNMIVQARIDRIREAAVNLEYVPEERDEDIEESETYKIVQGSYEWGGSVLSRNAGTVTGPNGRETYYNLNMSGVVAIMRRRGNMDTYWIRSDGCKMLGNYIMVAANLNVHPRGSIVRSSRGLAIVCDTGGFASKNPQQLDIATAW